MDRYGTDPRSFGATFWIPGVKTERAAKKRRKNEQKWARYSHLKRVRVADLFVMDRYMFIGVTCTIWPSFFFVDPHGLVTYGPTDLQLSLILGIGVVFIVFQYTRSLAFQTSQDTSVVNLLCKTPAVFPIGCLRRLRGGMSCRLRARLCLPVGGEAARPAARLLLASRRAADLRRHSRRGLRKGEGGGDQEQAAVRGRDAALADHAVVTR